MSVGAHCAFHCCRANKTLKKAGLGYNLLFLEKGAKKGLGAKEHKDMREELWKEEYQAERDAARQRGLANPALSELFALEAIATDAKPGEAVKEPRTCR